MRKPRCVLKRCRAYRGRWTGRSLRITWSWRRANRRSCTAFSWCWASPAAPPCKRQEWHPPPCRCPRQYYWPIFETARHPTPGIFGDWAAYCDFPSEHWTRIRTNNVIERLNREIRRRTRVVGAFPDGNSTLMLVCARLRHVAGTQWGNKKYMNMKHLEPSMEDTSVAG